MREAAAFIEKNEGTGRVLAGLGKTGEVVGRSGTGSHFGTAPTLFFLSLSGDLSDTNSQLPPTPSKLL
ncbi:hypothetical protein E2C01_081809 [Portunus trituberculatus]|uniref:Uncharacterized protein n=1 Tax=Portunus trituberculatus TaxID=210409 RepID=A0A5B7J3A5_PORTR|nr:hypothetical protein [Portunus trituberculatus]